MKFDADRHFAQYADVFKDVHDAGLQNDRVVRLFDDLAKVHVRNGQLASDSMFKLKRMVQGQALLNRLSPRQPSWPDVDPDTANFFGFDAHDDRPVYVPHSSLNLHTVEFGPTGSGKTTFNWFQIDQFRGHRIPVTFFDHKNEGRRLLNVYSDVLILRPDKCRENLLEPIGDPATYSLAMISALLRRASIHNLVRSKAISILERTYRGMGPGDAAPSLRDFQYLLAKLGTKKGDPTLHTVANALAMLNGYLGRASSVRKSTTFQPACSVTVYEYLGVPPLIQQTLMEIYSLRLQLRRAQARHTTTLREVFIFDEGQRVFGEEMRSEPGCAYFAPHMQLFREVRSSGIGIFAGGQSSTEFANTAKANAGNRLCFGTRSVPDARETALLLGLPENRVAELQSLPLGVGFLRSDIHPYPIKFRFPNFDAGPYLSDADVEARMKPIWSQMDQGTVFSPIDERSDPPISYREILQPNDDQTPGNSAQTDALKLDEDPKLFAEWCLLIRDVLTHPDVGVLTHYRTIGWSCGRGNRVKNALLGNALILNERKKSASGGRPTEILTVTPRGKEFLQAYEKRS
ncbi:MAG: hypothetical protein K1Y02_06165 [Candidatus Hydrogenedentes bacterium]|nr:hypothetical protein [Candidatus Hydrogenedentota bacterium]